MTDRLDWADRALRVLRRHYGTQFFTLVTGDARPTSLHVNGLGLNIGSGANLGAAVEDAIRKLTDDALLAADPVELAGEVLPAHELGYSRSSVAAAMLQIPDAKPWRFSVHLQHACRVVAWYLCSSTLVHLEHHYEQWPALCWEMGYHVIETVGPDDLQMMALVELVKRGKADGRKMPLPFTREAL